MKLFLKYTFALHVSLAYLGMLTGFGMVLFTAGFFYFLINSSGLPMFFPGLLVYLLLIIGPGAILLATYFYCKMHQRA